MPRTKKTDDSQLDLLDARERVTTAPCVPAIRQAVAAWKAEGCKGVTNTTRTLLGFWFDSDHRLPNGRRFRYHDAQREAIETLIYLYEVAKVRRHKALIETYYRGKQSKADLLNLLQYDDFARYCTKMATGSGKTKVMSLAIVWQYMNAVCENDTDYAKAFLILAPNVIVFERLKTDFAGGAIFRTDPLIPKELDLYWDIGRRVVLDKHSAAAWQRGNRCGSRCRTRSTYGNAGRVAAGKKDRNRGFFRTPDKSRRQLLCVK